MLLSRCNLLGIVLALSFVVCASIAVLVHVMRHRFFDVLTSASSSDSVIIRHSLAQLALPNICYKCPKLPEVQLQNTGNYNTVYYTQPVVRQGFNEVVLEATSLPQRIAALLQSGSGVNSRSTTMNDSSNGTGVYTVTVQYSTSHPAQTAVFDSSVNGAAGANTTATTAAGDSQLAVQPLCILMTSGSVMMCKWSAQVLIHCNGRLITATPVCVAGMVHATFTSITAAASQQPAAVAAAVAAAEVLAAVTIQYDMASLCRQLESVTGCCFAHSMMPCDVSTDAAMATTSATSDHSMQQQQQQQQQQQSPLAKRGKYSTDGISSVSGSVLPPSIPDSSSMYVAAMPHLAYGDSGSSASDNISGNSLYQG
jgi:hypothetical protein